MVSDPPFFLLTSTLVQYIVVLNLGSLTIGIGKTGQLQARFIQGYRQMMMVQQLGNMMPKRSISCTEPLHCELYCFHLEKPNFLILDDNQKEQVTGINGS